MLIAMKNIIKRKLGCSEEEADEILGDLEGIEPQLADMLLAWCDDRPYSDIEVCGYTIHSLMNDYGLGFIGALLTLDWVIKEPKEADQALRFGIR